MAAHTPDRSGGIRLKTQVEGSLWQRFFPLLTISLIGIILLAMLTVVFGMVRGEEFSPDAFRRRHFRFYQIPLLRLQITPVMRDDQTGDLEAKIARQIQAIAEDDPRARWDIVSSERSGAQPWLGDAKILCDYLDLTNEEGDRKWEQWHDNHPELTGVLWPLLAEVSQNRWYSLIPELLHLTDAHTQGSANGPELLETVLLDFLVSNYIAIGIEFQQIGDHQAAVRMFTLALNHQPKSAAAAAGRERSRAVLAAATSGTET